MLKRKIEKELLNWKNRNGHLPLIIYGARQIGKTTSIIKFAKENYNNVVVINFILYPEFKNVFLNFNVDDINRRISYINPNFKFIPNETLIFFDEIQNFMDVTTSLKAYALDGRFDVICSGSALGINNLHISSVSVGFKEEIIMKSLDFEEFLWAYGYDEKLNEELIGYMLEYKPVPRYLLDILNERFEEYIVVGGMPKIVDNFVKTKLYNGVSLYQRYLRKDYSDDIKQYVEGLDKSRITKIYESIILQLAKDNHKFQFSKLGHGARFTSYLGCFEWLRDAGIILIANNVNKLKRPLKLSMIDNNFRVYFNDTSLFMAFIDQNNEKLLRANKDFNIYKGGLYENVIISILDKLGFNDIYFYRSEDSTLELDFI